MSKEEDRTWEEACTKYAAMSASQLGALSNDEIMEALIVGFPEPHAYARALYQQRPASERFQMRLKPVLELVQAWLAEEGRRYAGRPLEPPLSQEAAVTALLELDHRTRNAGYARIGQWLLAQGQWTLTKREAPDAKSTKKP